MPANTRGNQEAQTSHQVSPQPAPLTEMEEIRQTIRCMSETLRLTTEMLRSTPEMNVRQAPSLVMCPARFSGEVGEDVDVFISEVTNYVRATRMTEDMARDGLGVLLRGRASSWWTTAQDTVPTWSEAITKLQEVFGARQPDFQIIWEIFGQRQGQEETKFFAQRVTKLFGRLNFATCERLHVATIYGLLEKKIRTRIPFKAATTVEALVGLATEVEAELMQERVNRPREPKTPSHAASVAKTRPFCTACLRNGHMAAECRTTRREPAMRRPRGTPTAPTKAAADEARRAPFACYGCGQEGVIRSNCRRCNPKETELFTATPELRTMAPNETLSRRPVLDFTISDCPGRAFVDTGARCSILGRDIYELLKAKQQKFDRSPMALIMADGSRSRQEVLSATLEVTVAGRIITMQFNALPDAENETLFGIDFIQAAGMIINFVSMKWQFMDDGVERELLTEQSETQTKCASVDCLREDEGKSLTSAEKAQLNKVLNEAANIFKLGGAPTEYAEHSINTGDHPPIAVPPYRLTPAKKIIVQKELDKMLQEGVIEECESAWTSPVVLVPKKNGETRFCVDYRQLNAVTVTDSYPLPLIDELVQSTSNGCYMSSIDLRAGYWQVRVATQDQDKTAFTTPFGV